MSRAAGAVLGLALLACSGGGDGDAGATTLRVFAAASLSDAFTDLAAAYENASPGVTIELNFAGSSALATQIQEGAPADVFASADEAYVQNVIEGGDAEAPGTVFARNELMIAVPLGNPGGVTGLADFARTELAIGLCAEEVPCGRSGRQALANAGVTAAVDTDEPDVRALLTKIEADELDAGIVYRTDVLAAGDAVEGIELPPGDDVLAAYAIVPIARADHADEAEAFVAFTLSAPGQAVLAEHGFLEP